MGMPLVECQRCKLAWQLHTFKGDGCPACDAEDECDRIEADRDRLAAENAELRAALLGTKTMTSQFDTPCWCRTVAMLYCVGQPQCKAARVALAAAAPNAAREK